jgi:transcriptional regulator of met regulon
MQPKINQPQQPTGSRLDTLQRRRRQGPLTQQERSELRSLLTLAGQPIPPDLELRRQTAGQRLHDLQQRIHTLQQLHQQGALTQQQRSELRRRLAFAGQPIPPDLESRRQSASQRIHTLQQLHQQGALTQQQRSELRRRLAFAGQPIPPDLELTQQQAGNQQDVSWPSQQEEDQGQSSNADYGPPQGLPPMAGPGPTTLAQQGATPEGHRWVRQDVNRTPGLQLPGSEAPFPSAERWQAMNDRARELGLPWLNMPPPTTTLVANPNLLWRAGGENDYARSSSSSPEQENTHRPENNAASTSDRISRVHAARSAYWDQQRGQSPPDHDRGH